jgi:hypothetical protein
MKIYHYHPDTKEYLGEGMADPSPLEKDVYLIPAHATIKSPPESIEGKGIVLNNDKWEYVNVEIIAQLDKTNDSPSTDTAFQKVEKLLLEMKNEIDDIKKDNLEKNQKLVLIEDKIKSLEEIEEEIK